MMNPFVKSVVLFLPFVPLIVLVSSWARGVGGWYEVLIPPIFALGSAVLVGRIVRRKRTE